MGTGIALDVTYVIDLIIVYLYTRLRYGYRGTMAVARIVCIQLPLGIAVYSLSLLADGLLYWLPGLMLCIVSLSISVYILHQKWSLWKALTTKFKSRFTSHA